MTPPPLNQLVTFLYCRDLTATDQFYRQVLQLPLVLDQGPCRIFRVAAGGYLGFCQAGTAVGRAADQQDGVIVTLTSDDVDGWHNYLLTQEVEIEKPPTRNETYNIYHLFLRDPDGYLVEIQTFLDPTWPKN